MAKKERKFVFLEATLRRLYCFEEGSINNWSAEEVIEDWFRRFPLNTDHDTRDGHCVGGSAQFIDAKETTIEDYLAKKAPNKKHRKEG